MDGHALGLQIVNVDLANIQTRASSTSPKCIDTNFTQNDLLHNATVAYRVPSFLGVFVSLVFLMLRISFSIFECFLLIFRVGGLTSRNILDIFVVFLGIFEKTKEKNRVSLCSLEIMSCNLWQAPLAKCEILGASVERTPFLQTMSRFLDHKPT